jgi:uncharacterized RDD family membrane protein YckC
MELYQEDRELVQQEVTRWRGYALSGWWRRVGATLVDALAVVPLGLLIGLALGVDLERLYSDSPGDDYWLSAASSVLATLVYFPVVMRATNGRTLGKMVTRIQVVRTDEHAMSFTRAKWREVMVKMGIPSLIPWGAGGVLTLLDDLWPLWDRENRAVHDMLAATRVVRSDIPRLVERA